MNAKKRSEFRHSSDQGVDVSGSALSKEKIEAQRIMAGMTQAERRQFLESLFIYVGAVIEISRLADQLGDSAAKLALLKNAGADPRRN